MSDLRIGPSIDGHTPQEDRTWVKRDNDGRDFPALRVSLHDRTTRSGAQAPAYGPQDNSVDMLAQVDRRIDQIRDQLAQTSGRFDPATGKPVHIVTGEARERLESELHHMVDFTRPLTERMGAEADAWHASHSRSTDEKLREAKDRQAALHAKAEDVASALEAERLAVKMLRGEYPRQG